MHNLPQLNLNHFFNLTDDTGIFQHAKYSVPDRNHGYCLDDNARALIIVSLLNGQNKYGKKLRKLENTFLSFVDYAYYPKTKRFRNFMSYEKTWLEECGSEDSQGRTIWAVGNLISGKVHHRGFIQHLKSISFPIAKELKHPRAVAYALLGLIKAHEKAVHSENDFGEIKICAQNLNRHFESCGNSEWLWFEERATYDNARIAEALIEAGGFLQNSTYLNTGMKLLDWLIGHQFEKNIFHPIGNENWLTKTHKSAYDQQPLEACAMVDACIAAWNTTEKEKYYDYALKAFNWFLGENSLETPLYNNYTGGCFDGLNQNGPNQNQGAESTIAWLHSYLKIRSLLTQKFKNESSKIENYH